MNNLNANEATSPRPMEIADLFRFARVADPSLSPDCKNVVYQVGQVDLADNKSSSHLCIASIDGKSPPRQLTSTSFKDSRPRFSPDGKSVLFQSTRSGSMQLWIINVDGGEARQLTSIHTEASNAVWSRDGTKIAFVSAVRPEYSELPFAESQRLNKEADDSGEQARIFDKLFYRHWDSYVDGKRQHLFVLKLKSGPNGLESDGEPHDATPGDRDAYPTSSTFSSSEDFAFSPDGSHLIFTAVDRQNEAWSTNFDICRVSIDNTKTDWETLTANEAADSGPRVSPNGIWLAWRAQVKAGYEADRWRLMTARITPDGRLAMSPKSSTEASDDSVGEFTWLDDERLVCVCDFRGSQRLLEVAHSPLPSKSNAAINPLGSMRGGFSGLSAVDGVLIYTRSSMSKPSEVYLFESGGDERELSHANQSLLSKLALEPPESIDSIPIEGDRRMQMWLLKPPGFDPSKKYPTVYLVHGGPQGAWEDAWSYRWCPQLWAAQGYVVAMPNPRGSTGFGQSFVEEISGDWGGKCFRDLMAGADYVDSLPYVDEERVAAAGASFGGYMMNWFAVNTGRFCCLITHCSVWNFESMWGTTDELWFDEYEHGGLPWEQPAKYRQFSPHVYAGKLGEFKTPMLVIHNDLDFRCPIGQGHELFASLQRQGVPSRFVNFPDEGHWVNKPANSRLWHEEIYKWLDRHCKGSGH